MRMEINAHAASGQSAMSDFVFEAQNISQSFGIVQALKNVSIGIAPGEVHAIIGENGAGKSTLMNIFCGKIRPTEGKLLYRKSPIAFNSPVDAQRIGIAIAPQEIILVPELSVSENILLGGQLSNGIQINWTETRAKAVHYLYAVDNSIDPNQKVKHLSKAQQQLVQISRAAACDAKILILDEPTAALTYRETERLYTYIKNFRANGGAIFYISHRLDEILDLSDRISVLRDGEFITELDPKQTNKEELVNHMVGRSVTRTIQRKPMDLTNREIVLKVDGLSRPREFSNVSFSLHRGEILGVSGLIGAGRTELAKCIFGLTPKANGQIELFGEPAKIHSPADAIRKGLVYLPEERKQEGLFPLLSISENMIMPNLDRFRSILHMRTSDIANAVDAYVKSLKIKIGRQNDAITSLSGGNQQKVIIGRWLMKNSKILIMDEPTRGIDVNAKFEIQRELRRLTDEGLSIIFISSEIEEVLDVSDRIMVLHEGVVKGFCDGAIATAEKLMQLAMS
jgi:ribose transport system ATP-binding protein